MRGSKGCRGKLTNLAEKLFEVVEQCFKEKAEQAQKKASNNCKKTVANTGREETTVKSEEIFVVCWE